MLCKKCKKELQDDWVCCPWCGLKCKKDGKKMYQRSDGLYEKMLVINGKRKVFRAKTEKEVMQKIAAFKGEAEVKKTRLFREYADDLEASWDSLSYYSLRGYKAPFRRCVKHFGDMPVGDITSYQIKLFLDKLGKTYAQKTVKTHLSIISQVLDLAVMNNEIDTNPASVKYKITGKKPVVRKEADEKYANIIREFWGESVYSWLAYFILNTGLRKGEALALQYKDINAEEKIISVSKSVYYVGDAPRIKEPKTKSGVRSVVLPNCVLEKINFGKPDEYMFSLDKKSPLPSHCVDGGWDRFCKAHDMGEWVVVEGKKNRYKNAVSFHQLRHYYATKGSELGIPREVMVEMMGHSSYVVTEGYTHIRKAALDAAAKKINGSE